MRRLAAVAVALAVALPPGALSAGPERIGTSVEGRPIVARERGDETAFTVLVVGCIHGNECAGTSVTRRLLRTRPTRYHLWVIRALNPDGAAAGTRQNARRVDLNRNFPRGWRPVGEPGHTFYSGPRPASEPETRAAMRFIERAEPDVTIWYHQAQDEVLAPRRGSTKVARCYARLSGMTWQRGPRLPGTATAWQNRELRDTSAFVVELHAGALTAVETRRHARAVARIGRWAAEGICPAG